MNGASLSSSLFLHPHSLYPLRSSSTYFKISIPHRIQAIVTKRNDSFRPLAVKKHTTGNSDVINNEDDEDDLDWDEFDEGEEEEEDEYLPIEKMNKWLEKKPRGFGQGKNYETTIEDKLLDEIEQSWKAQAANLNKLKNDPLKTQQQLKGKDNNNDVIKIGSRVRVSNLPKKKNVHRDLKVAFKGVSGILEMKPAVSGNKKTKDPVCKGFGFIDFKSEVDAKRFVEQFNGERLSFGKVVKQIKCQVVEFSSDESVNEEIRSDTVFEELPFTGLVEVSNDDVVVEDESDDSDGEVDEMEVEEDEGNDISSSAESPLGLRRDLKPDFKSQKQESRKHEEVVAETVLDDDDDDDVVEVDRADVVVVAEKNLKPLKSSIMPSLEEQRIDRIRRLELKLLGREKTLGKGVDSDQPEAKLGSGVEGKENEKKKKKKKKKIIVKGQGKKASKIEIPGSSKRLKVKEKALLTGVLVKYAAKAASTSNDE